MYAGEIKDIMSIPFGASHEEAHKIMLTKTLKNQKIKVQKLHLE